MELSLAYGICLLDKLRNEQPQKGKMYVACEEPEDLRRRLVSVNSSLCEQRQLPAGDYYFCYCEDLKNKNDTTTVSRLKKRKHIIIDEEEKDLKEISALSSQSSEDISNFLEERSEKLAYVVERKALSDLNGALDKKIFEEQIYKLLQLPIPRHLVIIYSLNIKMKKKFNISKGLDEILFFFFFFVGAWLGWSCCRSGRGYPAVAAACARTWSARTARA